MATLKRTLPNLPVNEYNISRAFYNQHLQKYDIMCPNVHCDQWGEIDIWALQRKGYLHEIEIKTSKADFKRDETKSYRRSILVEQASESEMWTTHSTFENGEYVHKPRRKCVSKGRVTVERRKYDWLDQGLCLPNKFFYLMPEALANQVQIPDWAGLFVVTEMWGVHKMKEAKFLHKNKPSDHHVLKTAKKFVHRWWEKEKRLT